MKTDKMATFSFYKRKVLHDFAVRKHFTEKSVLLKTKLKG